MNIEISRNKVHIIWRIDNDTIQVQDGIGGVFVQLILTADTMKALLQELDARRDEIEILKDKKAVEKEVKEEEQAQQLQNVCLAGKRDPQSKLLGGFIIVEQNGIYRYLVSGGIPEHTHLVGQWRWNGRLWQSF